ncbi:MAG: stage IV sporulation protein A [Oscillospiraceae bacterium]|nr:stage IV sporulation protein A [Oscillospiraceae bacterium]
MSIYADIAQRTGGAIYIGVVGPVRTGKSTFIKKFMERVVLPNIDNAEVRNRANDEMPQSASGKTVMTTEPKFVPETPVSIMPEDGTEMAVKLIDCVGYIVPGAAGLTENDKPRMVMTPWSEQALPFERAAELGTQKVIADHSTVAVAMTTDGSICEIPRENYVAAEKRIVSELVSAGKPFVLVVNSTHPDNAETRELAERLSVEYSCPVKAANCFTISEDEIKEILSMILTQFPPREIIVRLPSWLCILTSDNELKRSTETSIFDSARAVYKNGDAEKLFDALADGSVIKSVNRVEFLPGLGKTTFELIFDEDVFYKALGKECGIEINGEEELFEVMAELANAKHKYDRVAVALNEVERSGYGIVMPSMNDLRLEEPEIVKQSNGYGIKLRASAPSVHMIKANIEAEVSPIVGSERQSEDMVKFLLEGFEANPKTLWESNMFGKTLHELMNESLNSKLAHMPQDARMKLGETLTKIINEGSNGLICIIL